MKFLQLSAGERPAQVASVHVSELECLQVQELVQQTEMALGPVDILVNCAGVMYYTLMKNIHQDEWDRTIDINCKVGCMCDWLVVAGWLLG